MAIFLEKHLAEFYGQMLHEGLYFDPVMRDIEAMIASSQETVTGEARVRFKPGHFDVTGVKSPYSLMGASATYGETSRIWTGAEAAGFSKLHALPMMLAHRVRNHASFRRKPESSEPALLGPGFRRGDKKI
jgi:argininosuccinate synthase